MFAALGKLSSDKDYDIARRTGAGAYTARPVVAHSTVKTYLHHSTPLKSEQVEFLMAQLPKIKQYLLEDQELRSTFLKPAVSPEEESATERLQTAAGRPQLADSGEGSWDGL